MPPRKPLPPPRLRPPGMLSAPSHLGQLCTCVAGEGGGGVREPRSCRPRVKVAWLEAQGLLLLGHPAPLLAHKGPYRRGRPRAPLPAQVSPEMNFNFRSGRAAIMRLEPGGRRRGAGRRGRRAQEPSADLNFKGSCGPSASALCDCVCGAGVSAQARLRVRRVSGRACFVSVPLKGARAPAWAASASVGEPERPGVSVTV